MSTARTITEQNLRQTIEAGGIVILDFWAPWCGPCRGFAPTFEKAAGDNPDVVFGKVNTDEEQQLAGAFGIKSIPTVILLKNGQPVDGFMGALPEGKVREFLVFYKKRRRTGGRAADLGLLLVGLFLEALFQAAQKRAWAPLPGYFRGLWQGARWQLRGGLS